MAETVFKRKFRWTLEGNIPGGRIEPMFVKVSARPNLEIEETHLNGTPIACTKPEWEQITFTTFGFDEWTDDKKQEFWKVLSSCWNSETQLPCNETGEFKIVLYDGCGNAIEEWEFKEAYISGIIFSELDHSPSEPTEFELTIKYKTVIYNAVTNFRPAIAPAPAIAPMNFGMGIGQIGKLVKCPKCEFEFKTGGTDIIY